MSVTAFFKFKRTISQLQVGPLSNYISAYTNRLIAEGHCYQSGARGIRVAADYSAWLASKRHGVTDVNEASSGIGSGAYCPFMREIPLYT